MAGAAAIKFGAWPAITHQITVAKKIVAAVIAPMKTNAQRQPTANTSPKPNLQFIHPMKLTRHTIEALEHKACVADDSFDARDPDSAGWLETAASCRRAMASIESLRVEKVAQGELDNYLMGDLPRAEQSAIIADLCRSGYFPIFDPLAVCSRRLGKRTVGGIIYEVGSY